MILSQQVDVGVYKFVDFQRLLEVEIGYSSNEPVELCVKEAIEKAVESLIIEGIYDNLWELKYSEDINSKRIADYESEKEQVKVVDNFGETTLSRSALSIGINGGSQLYSGDYSNSRYEPAAALLLQYGVSKRFSFLFNLGFSKLSADNSFTSDITNADLILGYSILPQYRLNPFIQIGFGALNSNASDRNGKPIEKDNNWTVTLVAGAGLEYLLWDAVGIQALADYHYLLTDNLDGVKRGKYNDYYWGLKFGLNFYIGN